MTPDERLGLLARALVVTGCDENHFYLAQDLVRSLRDRNCHGLKIGFINFGSQKTPGAIADYVDRTAHVADPLPSRNQVGFKAARLGVKTKIPEYFPGFDYYVWLDGDTWVQNIAGVLDLIEAADKADLAVHSETYILTPNSWTVRAYNSMYVGEGEAYWHAPMVNAGVFSARAGSKLWTLWAAEMTRAAELHRTGAPIVFSDQIPLHRLLVRKELTFCELPAINNWLVQYHLPRFNLRLKKLHTPAAPHEEINIIHLAGKKKDRKFVLDNVGRPITLKYSDVRWAFAQIG